jgi:hypothetical protein
MLKQFSMQTRAPRTHRHTGHHRHPRDQTDVVYTQKQARESDRADVPLATVHTDAADGGQPDKTCQNERHIASHTLDVISNHGEDPGGKIQAVRRLTHEVLAPIDHDEFVKHDYKVEGESERVVSVADRKTMVDSSIPLTHSRTHARTHAHLEDESSRKRTTRRTTVCNVPKRERWGAPQAWATPTGCLGG